MSDSFSETAWARDFGFPDVAQEKFDEDGPGDRELWPYDPATDPDYPIGRSRAEVEQGLTDYDDG